MSIKKIMSGPNSKVKRANRFIDELRSRTTPLDRSLYDITSDVVYQTVLHVKPSGFQLTFRPKEDLPEALAAIIGDAVGNLRAALDHLANAIVGEWGTPPDGPLYFPVAPRKDLIAHTGLTAIEQALPGSKELLLEKIRPDGGPDEGFWNFYTLNKDDKHNFFIPTITAVRVDKIYAKMVGHTFNNCARSGFDATRPAILFSSPFPITISSNFNTSVEVKFGQGTPFQNEPVSHHCSQGRR
jgi:hypothetical protein